METNCKQENEIKEAYTQSLTQEFIYDASQKILFALTMLILFAMPWDGETRFAIFIFCSVGGRIFIMPVIQVLVEIITALFGGKKTSTPFLYIPHFIWRLFVLGIVLYITIDCLCTAHSIGSFLVNLVCGIIMAYIGYVIFAKKTYLYNPPSDPNKRGSKAWKEANGVVKVNTNLTTPLYRDKYGNYYEGTGFVPVPPPVQPVDKNYRPK